MAPSFSLSTILGILILCIFCPLISSASKQRFDVSAKCPHISTLASLKKEPRDNQTLRVLVPWRVGFEQFVKFQPDSCFLDGFSIQVFLQALRHMQDPRPPHYKFVLHGSGDETPAYDDMINILVNKEVDAIVADLTITSERMEKVGFTVPYLASSLVMVTPFRYGSAGALWHFLKPFSKQLWSALLGCFMVTGIVLYLLEDQNPDFSRTSKHDGKNQGSNHGDSSRQGRENSKPVANASTPFSPSSHSSPPTILPPIVDPPPLTSSPNNLNRLLVGDNSSFGMGPIYDQASHKRRIMNAYWFTSLCFFQTQQESVRTHLGRFVTVMWLFVMLIFNSSYTASLASLLSAQKRYPTIESFQALNENENISVGYLDGSFMKTYMDKLLMGKHTLKNFSSSEDYAQALREGSSKPDGVGAVVDELPYIQILLQSECDLTISSTEADHLPAFGGFGFAFQKGDRLIDEVSKMILEMAEDGTLQVLQSGWKIGDDDRGRCDSNTEEPSHLRLESFGGLFSIVAAGYFTCIIWRLFTKAIKSLKGGCSPLTRALPCTLGGSTIRRTGELSLSRRSNRVGDESHDDHVPS